MTPTTKAIDKLIYNYLVNKLITPDNTIKLLDTIKLDEFIKGIVTKKMSEAHHKVDSGNEAYRWRTGMGGELALEQMLGRPFVDLSIGDSNDYHVPDLSKLGLEVGIKSVERGKYPVIFKRSTKPEIVILRLADDTFSILGVALVEDLNKYQDDTQILSPSLRTRGTKTAFTGLHKLKGFNSLDELIKLI